MNTLKFGNGEWYGKKDTILAYNDLNSNFKPLPFSFDRASSATVVNKAGLIETVGSGEPRIDFSNDTKGALLLEPTRSNIAVNSENFDAWTNGNLSLTSNADISPEGLNNAYKVTFNNLNHYLLYADITVSSNTQYTFSFYVKRGTATNLNYRLRDVGNSVDIIAPTSYYSQTSASEWKRIEVTFTTPSNCTSLTIYSFSDGQSLGTAYIYGAQLEQGSYATSYIPTQGSAVTRVAETCNNGGNEQVINSTEGVLYAEISALENTVSQEVAFSINDGVNNRLLVRFKTDGKIGFIAFTNGVGVRAIGETGVLDQSINRKIALKYKENDYALWINGIKVVVDNTSTTFTLETLTKLSFEQGNNSNFLQGNCKDLRVYNTALTDQELINLTTI